MHQRHGLATASNKGTVFYDQQFCIDGFDANILTRGYAMYFEDVGRRRTSDKEDWKNK